MSFIIKKNIDEIVEYALNDKISFKTIYEEFSISEKQLKLIMRSNVRRKSYVNWRKRLRRKLEKNKLYKR